MNLYFSSSWFRSFFLAVFLVFPRGFFVFLRSFSIIRVDLCVNSNSIFIPKKPPLFYFLI